MPAPCWGERGGRGLGCLCVLCDLSTDSCFMSRVQGVDWASSPGPGSCRAVVRGLIQAYYTDRHWGGVRALLFHGCTTVQSWHIWELCYNGFFLGGGKAYLCWVSCLFSGNISAWHYEMRAAFLPCHQLVRGFRESHLIPCTSADLSVKQCYIQQMLKTQEYLVSDLWLRRPKDEVQGSS